MRRLLVCVLAMLAISAMPAAAASPLKHDRDVIRFFAHHPALASSPAGVRAQLRVLGHVLDELRTIQSARPAHLALWRCLEKGESGGDGIHPGSEAASNGTHFNVLQMTNPWAGLNPIGLSYAAIEQAAETQYARSGYSRSWLGGQWAQTIGPCWGYA